MDLPGIISETLRLAGVAGLAFGSGWAWRERTCKAELAAKNAEISSKNAEIAAHGAALHAGRERGRVLEEKLSVLEEHRPLALIREIQEVRRYAEDATRAKQVSDELVKHLVQAIAELGPAMEGFASRLADESHRDGLRAGLLEGLSAMGLIAIKTQSVVLGAGVWEPLVSEMSPYVQRLTELFETLNRGEKPAVLPATAEMQRMIEDAESNP